MTHYYAIQIAESIDRETETPIPAKHLHWRFLEPTAHRYYDTALVDRIDLQEKLLYHVVRVKRITPFSLFWWKFIDEYILTD